jgi:hypothetical protein
VAFLASAPALVSLIGTGVTTAATVAAMSGQRKLADHNAKLDEAAAKAAADQAARDEEMQRRESNAFLGKQQAAFAEAGLGSAGTSGLLIEQSAVLAELDALNIRYGGRMRGTGLLSQAAATRAGGKAAARSSGLLAGAQLLTGVSDAYSQHRRLNPAGAT